MGDFRIKINSLHILNKLANQQNCKISVKQCGEESDELLVSVLTGDTNYLFREFLKLVKDVS